LGEAEIVRAAFGSNVHGIHHIGSASVPGFYAKPAIDILVEVKSIEAVDRTAPALAAKGYEAMGGFGLAGRRYFRKDNPAGTREVQVHAFAAGSAAAERHLAFRDYLRAHADVAEEYSQLKRGLAEQYPSDLEAYMDGKDPFIKSTEEAALAWSRSA
jgi:GrpB-like predicted nucleotidyltransferase (UPF0157 family)